MGTTVASKITSKGQVTVPEAIRRRLGLQKGDQLEWAVGEQGQVLVRKVGHDLDDLVGMLGKPPRSLTVEQMNEAIHQRFGRKPSVRR